jgi:hypothetical protein
LELFRETSEILVAFRVIAAIIKKQKRGETEMDKVQFNKLFAVLVQESGIDNTNSTVDMDDAYSTYLDLVKQIDESDTAVEHMARMVTMAERERLHWRMCLAEEGIEMTPSQVDEYVVILELALSST